MENKRNPLENLGYILSGQKKRDQESARFHQKVRTQYDAEVEAEKQKYATEIAVQEERKRIKQSLLLPNAYFPEDMSVEDAVAHLTNENSAITLLGKFDINSVFINGRNFTTFHSGDWDYFGDTRSIPLNAQSPHQRILSSVFETYKYWDEHSSPENARISRNHLVAAANILDTEDAVVSYLCKHSHWDEGQRIANTVLLNFRMPSQNAGALLNLIRQTPDAAELFVQNTAKGFQGDENIKGIKRLKSDSIAIVKLETFSSDLFNRHIEFTNLNQVRHIYNLNANNSYYFRTSAEENIDRHFELYPYTRPYGGE